MVGSSPSPSALLGLAMQIRILAPFPHQRSSRCRRSRGPTLEKTASRRISCGLKALDQVAEGAGLAMKRIDKGRPAMAPPRPSVMLSGKQWPNALNVSPTNSC